MTIFLHYVLPLIIGIVIARWWLRIFRKLSIMDKPGNDLKNTRRPVPTMQGIFVYLAFFIIIAICFPVIFRSNIFRWLFVWTLPIIIFEFIEELRYIGKINRKIPTIFRLVWHILWAVLAIYVWWFGPQELLIWAHKFIIPQRWFALFFVVRSIICINAINRFDGIYAQASW
jgi:UDP-N-acetylmuramyl pentapeptide phosphotransferase/UDP-N-acetylglucosamine-1-phosphate transferase